MLERAMRLSADVLPDIPIPEYPNVTEGYLVCYDRVELSWSKSCLHGTGPRKNSADGRTGASQGGRALYSTKSLALKAMRARVARRHAEDLARIDRRILEAETEEACAKSST